MQEQLIQTVPSGCVHLVFHRGCRISFASGKVQPKSFIRGQLSYADTLVSSKGIDMIAVVFEPLGLHPFGACLMSELYNQYVDIEELDNPGLKELNHRIASEEDSLTCISLIERFLTDRLDKEDYNLQRICQSVQSIRERSDIDVSSLADKACLGYRQFKRVFTEYVGMNPKEYIRVVRFQRVLHTLQHEPDMDITQLAYACGFFDHPHLVKDFKALSGYSPTTYLAARKPYSTFFSKDCRLNVIKAD